MIYWRLSTVCIWFLGVLLGNIDFYNDSSRTSSILDVKDFEFKPVTDFNKGLDNGSYWIKINTLKENDEVLRIKSYHLRKFEAFDSTGSSISEIPDLQYPAFDISKHHDLLPLYVNLQFDEEANFPMEFTTLSEVVKKEQGNIFGYGLFYGVMVFIILINLFLFFSSGDNGLLYYAAVLLISGISLAFRDNIPYMFGLEQPYLVDLELLFHVLLGIVGAIFAYTFVRLKSSYPELKLTIITFSTLSVIFMVGYWITGNYFFFALADTMVLLTITATWITSGLASKTTPFFYLVSFVFAINIYCIFDFFVLYDFGLSLLPITPFVIKLGMVAEMIIISIAILRRWQFTDKNNSNLIKQLSLREEELEKLSQYKKVEDINDSYLESLIDNYNLNNCEVKILHALSTGTREDKLNEKLKLPDFKIKQSMASLYKKLGIAEDSDFLNMLS